MAPAGPSGTAGQGSAANPAEFSYLAINENTTVPAVLTTLSNDACKQQNAALPLKVDSVPQQGLDQKLQLLAGQNALPVQFAAGGAPALTVTLDKAGNVLDFEKSLNDLGKIDDIEPAAISTIKKLYGGKFNVLPYEFNVEGIWYNKELLADNGITEPKTWADLTAAAEKLKGAGVTPFAASGEQGWPLTRLIGNYLFRDLGPDAMQKVADKQAKLTDPQYVKAAQAVADLGAKGYFGEGVGSVDYDTATNQFLSGKAGMFYMGSWALANFADKKQNKIGAENIGFVPFPAVDGGQGSPDALAANVGLPSTFNAKLYNDKVGSWLGCIADNYGTEALQTKGAISGFKPKTPVKTDALTTDIQGRITSGGDNTVLWFEALFGTKALTTSTTNAAQLVTGKISAADYMKKIQADLDQQK